MSNNKCLPSGKNIKNKSTQGKMDNKSLEMLKSEKLQNKPEQLRHSQNIDNRINNKEEVIWQESIKQVMDLTQRSEDEVIMALHDSDGDLNRAVNDLLEGVSPEWEVKKKKPRQSGPKQNSEQCNSNDSNIDWDDKRQLQNNISLRIRGRAGHNNRGWKRRENKENEKNIEDTKCESNYSKKGRNISGRQGRGRGSNRGLSSRSLINRDDTSASSNSFSRPIDTWTGSEDQQSNCKDSKIGSWNAVDASEDWENEEYTGSLADTKVFTPSTLVNETLSVSEISKSEEVSSIKPLQSTSIMISNPQRQTKHRPRLPPPSKIPSSAVEMPGDTLNSSISFLDVQFGALEFGSDSNIDASQDKYTSSTNPIISNIESTLSSKTITNPMSTLNDGAHVSTSQKFNSTKMLRSDDQSITKEITTSTQSAFTNLTTTNQANDLKNQEMNTQTSHSSNFNETGGFQTTKSSYPTSVSANSYNVYSCNSQTNQTSFPCSTTSTSNFSIPPSVAQTAYSTSYSQSNIANFSQTSPSSSAASVIYNQTSTSQGYQSSSGLATAPLSQYQVQSTSTNASNHNSSYINTGYQNSSNFKSTPQTYQQSNTTFTTSMSQSSNAYSSSVQSVYSNTYSNYGCPTQSNSQDHKLHSSKDLQYEANATVSSNTLTTTTCTLGLTSNTVNTTQTKTTVSSTVPKSTMTGLVTSSSSSSNTVAGSGTTSNIPPVLSHQYIMGQSVPYATFQQPHMYSYEDIQLMQQRMPHMPTTGYYDAALGYQTTGPVTSLGNSRSDALSGVQAVQGQYTNINDARFTRTDSNASPVSSTISQQTATQHQQPLMNPIPPGYAYFYGGGIMPAGGFQYGTPAIYPQIATAGSAGSTSGAYNAKPASYGSGYGNSTNYDTLTNSGTSGDYKTTASGYSSNPTSKNGSSSGNTNVSGSSTDINTTLYAKGHVTLNKVNSYEKQTFHSATPPPFGLTSNQNANVISGYGAHLFIPTVPHQLHQPLHQDNGNSSGQRTNTNSQNKAQVKPGYSTSYWAGGN